MKKIAKILSHLLSEELVTELKLKEPHYIMIFPQHLIRQLGIQQNEISFQLVTDGLNKLTFIGPQLGSQPKSVTSNPERGGFVI